MKYCRILLTCIVLTISLQTLYSQSGNKSVFVLVHGTWGGGWAFKEVDSLLSENGNIVYRPTLTGQGERVHLSSPEIGLKTHITDIVNTILYEDLHDVILVGHSYGGMVITGVADSIPKRIKKLVYVDAVIPENGESISSIFKIKNEGPFRNVNGYLIPTWVAEGQKPPKDVPHPYKTYTDTIILKNPLRIKLPTTYVLTVDKGKEPKNDDFASQAERAKEKGWIVLQLEADHNPQWSSPEEFVKLLQEIVEN
ncbi:Pimeloyl-ACP methyl ester carboxylesterase [Zhouia amylolytica]|uniref:Pimeloyl-ACP methyl ester carboxylesterase n=1 Tax=Zhouia amylolytica TaxID=376730 RepID=A0A1I6TWI9_9FLAO|nr:alpha/beta hydrolase [Zhouia amylolytica]SFS93551.1 Pimeloyl-ACP methyl ester carboxylesterase [Zhouia amylolytica]